MKLTRLTRLLILMKSMRRCGAAVLRHARAAKAMGQSVRYEHAMIEMHSLRADLVALTVQVVGMMQRMISAA